MKSKILIILLFVFLLGGCADYRELTDMAIVSTVGIDKKDDEYRVMVQILNSNTQPSSEEKVSVTVMVYEGMGKTLHESFRNMILSSPKKMYAGHVEVVIISEEIAKNLSEIIDFFLRDPEMEKDFKLLIAKDYSVKEIMEVTDSLVSIPAESMDSSLTTASTIQGNVTDITFDEIVSNEMQTGIDPVIPAITIKEIKSEDDEINPKKKLTLSKEMGTFSKGKFAGYLNSDTTLFYNLINGYATSNVISFKCSDKEYASIEIVNNKSSMKYDAKKNNLKLDINLTGSLSEVNCNIDINNKKDMKKMQDKLKSHLEKVFDTALSTIKDKSESDFLGIERYAYRSDYKYYEKHKKEIKENIKNIKSDIKINILFNQTGLMKKGDEKY